MTGVKQYLHIYSKESVHKVVFGDNSLGDTKRYGSVNCNEITFTRVEWSEAISISQLYNANFKVLFTKTQGTIFNQNNEVVLIYPRKRDVYVIDIPSYNEESNAYLFRPVKPQTISHNKYTLVIVDEYSRYTWVFCLQKKSDAADYIMSFIKKMNEVRIKELRSDNGTEFKNHKLEEFYDEKGISQNFSSPCTLEQYGVAEKRNKTLIEAARTVLNMKRHGKTVYDVFRGRSPDINYFHVFGCPVHIHNHRDHLGKFDEKADDGFFLGYSSVAKDFRVFNIRRQEMEEAYHVTFSEDNEAISQSSTEGDETNFNENRSFDDEFLVQRNKVSQCSSNNDYFPYVPAYDPLSTNNINIPKNNITPNDSFTLQDSVSPEEPPELTIANDNLAPNKPDHFELGDCLEPAELQYIVINEPISEVQPLPTTITPSTDVKSHPHVMESGSINVGKSSVVKNTVIKCSGRSEVFNDSRNLNETALKGAIAIPAEFVRRHKLYNHADSNNSTKFTLKCFDPPFEKEMVLRKLHDREKD
ncbi:retrovirus-related pol polyprotein from transposon TNT 1-94 [Tanacetum coccineum]|uniref:Retrovirus-related pol polyprotein from transposon TNT 1-94 n=1 Tax=Tanacetum coccineum TaxID=301880 RepID=A0ABQ4WS54_9ASTR